MTSNNSYSIGEFSKKVNLSIDTLRYYEKEQLILPKRNDINRRIYDEKDVAWIAFILRLKQTGMSIRAIKDYAGLRYQGNSTISARMQLLDNQLELLLEQRKELDQHLDFLTDKISVYKDMLANKVL